MNCHRHTQAAERIIQQRRRLGTAGGGQPVLGVIAVGHAAIREVTLGIIAEARRPRTGILVEAIGSIAAVDVDMVGERKTVVRKRPRRDLPGGVIAKALRHIVRRAGAIGGLR